MRRSLVLLSAGLTVLSTGLLNGLASAQNNTPRNLILFIPDGLRALKITPETAPAMAEVRDKGVNFKNSHSLFPTFTMANGSAMSTGHYLGDTGVFSNTIWTNYTSVPAGDTVVPFIENDAVLGDIDEHFKGDYLNEETILKLARDKGFSTAAMGKLGPTYQFDHTDKPEKPGLHSVVFDDCHRRQEWRGAVGRGEGRADQGRPAARHAASAATTAKAGDAKTPGTTVANVAQQAYFADVATKVVLPMFKARNKPFVLVFWSRDPDGSQHNTGRQPQPDHAGHQRPDLDGRHQERRQQPRPAPQGAGRARACRQHQHHGPGRPRLLDHLQGEQDQPLGQGQL